MQKRLGFSLQPRLASYSKTSERGTRTIPTQCVSARECVVTCAVLLWRRESALLVVPVWIEHGLTHCMLYYVQMGGGDNGVLLELEHVCHQPRIRCHKTRKGIRKHISRVRQADLTPKLCVFMSARQSTR